jgi:glycosyltransferase involved in cell wall biosynthesis
MARKILFLTLKTFSSTGGIEKVNRIVGKALYENGYDVKIFASYDVNKNDDRYFPSAIFSGFKGNKIKFTLESIKAGVKNDIVILSHINLIIVGYLIKLLSPKTKLVLFAHGIEIWKPLASFKKRMLLKCDRIFAVSTFTNDKLKQLYRIKDHQSVILNNCLDPYLEAPESYDKTGELLSRYGLHNEDFVLLTLTRLSSDERYKGYDKVLDSIRELINEYPMLRYLIIGKYDIEEKTRMDKLIASMNLKDFVIFTGFIPDEELGSHYALGDLYVMPSLNEGFGIVFIEAMYYGLPVIAGNKDGSSDALLNGKLGILVDPDTTEEISQAIKRIIENRNAYKPDRNLLMEEFSYPVYKKRLTETIEKLYN